MFYLNESCKCNETSTIMLNFLSTNQSDGKMMHLPSYKEHQIPKLTCFSSRLAVVLAQSIGARCSVENEDIVGAALTGDAPTTSDRSTIYCLQRYT